MEVVAAAGVERIIARDTAEQRLLGTYGIIVRPLSPEEQGYFKTGDGLLVREVWTDFGGDVAGLRPGDIVLTVNGQAVTSPADLAVPAASASPVNLVVQRWTIDSTCPTPSRQRCSELRSDRRRGGEMGVCAAHLHH